MSVCSPWIFFISSSFFFNSISSNLDFNIFIAVSLLLSWDLSFWQVTTTPVGKCVILTAESVILTCCPPAPLALYVSILISAGFISTSTLSSTSGTTSTEAKEVCLFLLASKGEILTSLWTPFSDFK